MARPRILVLAGVNGAGKSSIGGDMLHQAGIPWFNPDTFTRELVAATGSPLADANAAAWQEGLRRLNAAIAHGEDYAFETTLGGNTIAARLGDASESHDVLMWFCGLDSPEHHMARVRLRVSHGGHDIPEAKIRERYRTSIANLIRLTELEDQLASMVVEGALSAGHARSLLALPPGESRKTLATEAVRQQWSVRRLEEAVRRVVDGAKARGVATVPGAERAGVAARDAVLTDLERQLGQHLGTKVQIRTNAKGSRGALTIEFYGLDHFDGLLAKLGVRHHSDSATQES